MMRERGMRRMEEEKARMEVLRGMRVMLRREILLNEDGFATAVVACRGWMSWHPSVTISHGPWRPAVDEEGDGDAGVSDGGRGRALWS
jgi:hypothetical protein